MALDVLEALEFAEVRLLPSRQPPHRAMPGADSAQRLAMLTAGVANQAGLMIDRRELDRAGPSYMLDTLASLRAELPTASLCLLIGRDAFNELPTWHRWRELFHLAHFLVLERPGKVSPMPAELIAELSDRIVTDPTQLQQQCSGRVFAWQATQLDISATRIRTLIGAGRSPRYLLPEVVFDYIQHHGLYQGPNQQ